MGLKRFVSSLVAAFTAFTAVSGCMGSSVSAEENITDEISGNDWYSIEPVDMTIPSYSDYFDLYSQQFRPDSRADIKGDSFTSCSDGIAKGSYTDADSDTREGCLIWNSHSGEVCYEMEIPESGCYSLEISYCPISSGSSDIEFSLEIDGKQPYDTASRLTLNRVWMNEKDICTDSRGNQVRPSQVQKEMWQTCFIGDTDGLFSEPLMFYLEKGKHEIRLKSERADLAVERISFRNPDALPYYKEYVSEVSDTALHTFIIEGENALYKSSPSLSPTYDNTDCLVSPADPVKMMYNTIGDDSWKKSLQTVTWNIPKEDIAQSGWYKIGIKARQDKLRGFYSNRRIYIDGKVPCQEMAQVKFYYDTDWNIVSPQADGESVCVYLDASADHTLTMEAVPGEVGDSVRRLEKVVTELNTYYRKILMITGPSPDKYTDYYVHEKIPELVDEFSRISDELKAVQNEIELLSGTKGSEAAAVGNLAVILDKCTEKPLKIPNYLSQIKNSIASVSAWMRDCREQPLEVDYIEFTSPNADFSECDASLSESLAFSAKSFIGSFFEDYTTLSDVTGEEAVNVWVSLGRDQAQVIKEMTENIFMQETNIPVSVNLVTGGVVEASLAGKGPDLALFLGGEFPVNLAARDMLVDMTQFPDYGETVSRFGENAMTSYTYNGGVYGMPVSRSWPMMFCRTDVLTELGIDSPPETWEELIDILPSLQRNYMSAGLVLPSSNVSPATETGHTFALLMLQKGLNYYTPDLTASAFDSVGAVQSFEEWTDFYTKYSFEQFYDAFSRFRTGEYPIVISNYTFSNQLTAAAPEIRGLWEFFPVPGTERADGTVSHAANSNGSGAVIFNKVKNKENAWEFVKWFTSEEVQAEYSRRIEGLMGTMGRFDTANTAALGKLSWSQEELEKLMAQHDELTEIPITPSSYAVTRNIMNAFRETVNNGENPRDTLIWYDRDINDEIKRKNSELNK